MFFDGILTALVNLILFGFVVLCRKIIHAEGLESFWLHTDRRGWRLFVEGTVMGLGSIALYALVVRLLGEGNFYFNPDGLWPTLGVVVAWGIGFLGVALFEESLFRGYILVKLVQKSVWLAIGVQAFLFGFLHIVTYSSESSSFFIGLVNAAFIAVILAVVTLGARSLMPALGFHLGWNLAQNLLFSAFQQETQFFYLRLKEGSWLGKAGFLENSVLVTGLLVILLLYVLVRFRGRREGNTTFEGRSC